MNKCVKITKMIFCTKPKEAKATVGGQSFGEIRKDAEGAKNSQAKGQGPSNSLFLPVNFTYPCSNPFGFVFLFKNFSHTQGVNNGNNFKNRANG